ncbi:FlgD Ig-like domain-containing protein [Natronincola peptidivorans]|uniref:FlgD Ig-like domain-containing protein n=1 Tax=Natronincola peptidivorans TaxID=426128 RepID=A0A1I0CIC8_9FIRM|nr:LysM peptidoglycan-binding domain-containing protein [Natronincola peptidivorans]SET19364.1 FlgD Ig-like domain-containing protein [Natronincola peptidivorans]
MKYYARKAFLGFCLVLLLMLLMPPLEAMASSEGGQPPNLTSSNLSTRIVAYHGNDTPGHVEIFIATDKPTLGNIDVIGSAVSSIGRTISTKIYLSTEEYKEEHRVNWAPWNDQWPSWEHLPAGEYTLKLNLYDEDGNQSIGMPLGTITVVEELNPRPIIEEVKVDTVSISPEYGVIENLATISYQLNRPAEVLVTIYQNGDSYETSMMRLQPGIHTIEWDGRNNKGMIMANGEYAVNFSTRETTADWHRNYFDFDNMIEIKDGDHNLPEWRADEIVTSISLDGNEISMKENGNRSIEGNITLGEDAYISVWMVNATKTNVSNLISYQKLSEGTHSFNWSGKDPYGGDLMNGTYYLKVTVFDATGTSGDIIYESEMVTIKDGHRPTVSEDAQWVRVIEDTVMSVYPMGSRYIAKTGETFPILEGGQYMYGGSGSYTVLVAGEVPGLISVGKVELTNIDQIPMKWGYASQQEVNLLKEPINHSNTIENATLGTPLRIIKEEGNWYRVLSPLGRQLFVKSTDLSLDKIESQEEPAILHIVVQGDTLWKISQAYGVTVDAISKENNFNPANELNIGKVLIIPKTATAEPVIGEDKQGNIYTVAAGDSLWEIAQRHGTTVEVIAALNNLDVNHYLEIGKRLQMPTSSNNEVDQKKPQVIYTVKSGDSLWKIAQLYHTTINAISEVNQINPADDLMIGQRLIIPMEPNSMINYVVRAGDSLWKISQSYNTTVEIIASINEFNPNNTIFPGQQLKIQVR